MIRVLVVDDSAFMRKAISMMLERAPDVTVVDTATNGAEGVEKACRLRPDITTMDVEMPKMNGITAVRQIMKEVPHPILMVSSLTAEGAETTVEALRAGAVDFIPKQHSRVSLQITKIQERLIEKVRSLANSPSRLFRKEASSGTPAPHPATPSKGAARRVVRPAHPPKLIVIGISTGGPFALQRVVPALPAALPVPVAIVQHMPPHFTRSLADRLNTQSPLHVAEAIDGQRIEAGHVVIAAGGRHLTFERRTAGLVVRTPTQPDTYPHCPSVDVMFGSACDIHGAGVLAVVMTGMGKDGLQGAQQIRAQGGTVFTQDEASCVVYGMPHAVAEAGLADAILTLEDIPETLERAVAHGGDAPAPPQRVPLRPVAKR